MRKLKTALADSNTTAVRTLDNVCINSPTTKLIRSFFTPREYGGYTLTNTVAKPVLADRLNKAFEKAFTLLGDKKQYALFTIDESGKKVKIRIPDVLLVTADTEESRHKEIILSSAEKYTILDHSLTDLLQLSSKLVQVNKRQLVSVDAVNGVHHDLITLKPLVGKLPAYITLGRTYHKSFKEKLHYK